MCGASLRMVNTFSLTKAFVNSTLLHKVKEMTWCRMHGCKTEP